MMNLNEMNLEQLTEWKNEEIKKILKSDGEIALETARAIHAETCGLEWCESWDLEEIAEITSDTMSLIGSIVYGNVTSTSLNVRYNGYGNLETVTEEELQQDAMDYARDIMYYFENEHDKMLNMILPSEIEEILEQYEDAVAELELAELE